VTYSLANDVENFNKGMASDSLEWHVSKQEDWSCILASRVMKVCGLHIGCFAV
jgi:hypothetical protein